MILRKLDIGDQAMYNSRVMMQCLDQSTRMMPDLLDIILGVETDFGHAINKIIAKVEGVNNNIEYIAQWMRQHLSESLIEHKVDSCHEKMNT